MIDKESCRNAKEVAFAIVNLTIINERRTFWGNKVRANGKLNTYELNTKIEPLQRRIMFWLLKYEIGNDRTCNIEVYFADNNEMLHWNGFDGMGSTN